MEKRNFNKFIMIRVSDEMREDMKRTAKNKDMSVGAYLRSLHLILKEKQSTDNNNSK